jgi:hypothetical protein
MNNRSNLIDVEAVFIHQTDLAIGIRIDEDSRDVIWLPKSLIEIDPPDPKRNQVCVITLSERFAIEKRLV